MGSWEPIWFEKKVLAPIDFKKLFAFAYKEVKVIKFKTCDFFDCLGTHQSKFLSEPLI